MSTSDRADRVRVRAAPLRPEGAVRLAAYLGAAALAAAGVVGVVRGASPLVTLAAGVGVGLLWMLAQRSGGGDA